MTVTTSSASSGAGQPAVPPEDLVSVTVDGIPISVPKGTLVIRAAELLGIGERTLYDKLKRFGLFTRFSEKNFFATLGEAVSAYLAAHRVEWVDWKDRTP